MVWRRALPAVASVVFGLMTLSSCGEAKQGIDDQNKIIDIGNTAEPLTLDPAKTQGIWESNIIGNMFIGLFTEDAASNVIPGMAERWETSADGLTWTFFLRHANWSDGQPVTAYDFEFAMRRVLDPKTLSESAPILYVLKNAQAVNEGKAPLSALGAHAIDERTLELTLEHPAAYLPGILKHSIGYPVPKHVVERWGNDWIKPAHVVVNGPYTLVKWWANYLVHLRKNPTFYDAASVCLRELFFYPTNDADAAVRRMESGALAWNTTYSPAKTQQLQKTLPGYLHTAPYMVSDFFSINTTRPMFKDPRVRRALSLAIDRDFIIRIRGGGVPSYQFVPQNMPGYPQGARTTWADTPLAERRAEARRLLEAAGYGPNKPLKFAYSFRNSRDNPRIAVVAQADWRAIAPWVQVELRSTEVQIHYANLRAKNFDVGDGGWVGDYPDAQTYLALLETRSKDQNWPGYSNPAYDALMVESSNENDPAKRAEMLRRAEQMALDDDVIIPVLLESSFNLISPRITGFVDNVEDIHRARWMCIADGK